MDEVNVYNYIRVYEKRKKNRLKFIKSNFDNWVTKVITILSTQYQDFVLIFSVLML